MSGGSSYWEAAIIKAISSDVFFRNLTNASVKQNFFLVPRHGILQIIFQPEFDLKAAAKEE